MPCYNPLRGYWSKSRNANGKRFVVFDRGSAFSDLPVDVPCGSCIGCRLDKSRQWAMRCVAEASEHDASCFVTLTFDNEHLPPRSSLDKSHLQDFLKRLRFAIEPVKVRYFACGEYGENFSRPHYHLILFGYDFPDRVLHSSRDGKRVFTSPQLSKLWPFGFHYIGGFSFESAAYVARYCTKKINGAKALAHYGDRVPEFSLMSLKPGIGATWYAKYHKDVYPSDFLLSNGVKVLPPKYFDKLLERADPLKLKKIKLKRRQKMLKQSNNNTLRRLDVRRIVKTASIKSLHRHYEASHD